MPPKRPHLQKLIVRAAELRARGVSWAAIAEEMNRSPKSIMNWPQQFPEEWQQATEEAQANIDMELGAEGHRVLQFLLRSEDEKIRRDAARLLIELQIKERRAERDAAPKDATPLTTDAQRVAQYLEDIDNDHLPSLMRELLATLGIAATGSPAAPVDGEASSK